VREGEDQVEVGDRQPEGLRGFEPGGRRGSLALGTMAVAAGMGREVVATTGDAAVLMPAQGGGATDPQRVEHAPLDRRQRRQGVGSGPGGGEHLRQGRSRDQGAGHRPASGSGQDGRGRGRGHGRQIQLLERTLELGQALLTDVQVRRGAGEAAVPEQMLNDGELDAGFEQMRRKGVPLMPSSS